MPADPVSDSNPGRQPEAASRTGDVDTADIDTADIDTADIGGAAGADDATDDATDAEFEELLSAATGAAGTAHRPRRSKLAVVLWALAAVPGVALALLLSMAVRVRLADGAWPVRNQPDPKDLGIHNTVTVLTILGSFVIVVLVPAIALVAYFSGSRRIPVKPPVVAVAGLAALVLVLVGDLGGLGEWIGD